MARGTETRGNGTRRPPRRTPTTRRATSDQATSGAAPDRQASAAAVEEAAQADEAAARRPDEALQEAASPTPVAPDRAGVGGARLRNDVAEAMATAAAASGAVTAAAVAAQAARVGDPVQRAQEQVAVLIQEQIQDSADTVRRLMTCTSLPAAVSVQVEATGRAVARLAAHGQAMAALGREMVRAFDPTRRR